VLLPGKAHTGQLHVYDIGISGDKVKPKLFLNAPALWKHMLPLPNPDSNKYSRGHTVVIGGGMSTTGAARLSAMAALRCGSGLVSVACTQEALPIYAMTLTAVMTKQADNAAQLASLLEDKRITALLIGPGCGVTERTRDNTLQILKSKKACVIDADALSIFQFNTKPLFDAIAGPTVLTPHEGEFERLFATKGVKTERAKDAAKQSGAVIVLKGNDTVIAAPDGRVSINANAPVWLATAGSGDVLAGIIAGLMGQGMPAYEAACAGTWIQGEVANRFGPGLIAEDLTTTMPATLKALYDA
ncbi:MAG: NAD(P)H-hydrate dehydratase, partial [Rickettsiales bacterium]|nr:NAD(P)H-hydrate dehydratase [Rickettsiales bacterium]